MTVNPVSSSMPTIPTSLAATVPPRPSSDSSESFSGLISQVLQDANSQQVGADMALQQLATGNEGNMHDVVLAVAQADLSFRFLLEMRNKLVESYQEIMRMQF